MGAAVQLRKGINGKALRRPARGWKDVDQTRRLLAPAAAYDGEFL